MSAIISLYDSPPMVSNEYIDMWLWDGIFVGRYKKIVINEKAARKIWQDREQLCNGEKYATLWDGRNVIYWGADGRKFQSSSENYRLMKAGAVVAPNSHVSVVVFNFFLKIYRSPIPVKLFVKIEDAYTWIEQYR